MEQIIKNKFFTKGRVENWWFTSDEHYGHDNVIKYNNRPFHCTMEMDSILISNHNNLVGKNDVTIHVGDFTLSKNLEYVFGIIKQLNGKHVFVEGSHDVWMRKIDPMFVNQIYFRKFGKKARIAVCHYKMESWPCSHYDSLHVHGHHHGKYLPDNRRMDVGVDTNNFKPYHLDEILKILKIR